MGTELMAFESVEKLAVAVAKTKMWKGIDTPEKALSLMLLCQAEGLHPMTAMRRYDIIDGGAPTLKSEALLAEFLNDGGTAVFIASTTEVCEAKFSHPKTCPHGMVFKWTIQDAQRANLANKFNWKAYPRQMLRARVVSEAIQVVHPGAGLGMLTTEEAMDMRNNMADTAADFSAALTGEPLTEVDPLPEVNLDDKQLKAARAELNKALQACVTMADFRKASIEFKDKYTKAIWVKLTGHDKSYRADDGQIMKETFYWLARTHQARVERDDFDKSPEGQNQWRQSLAKCSNEGFAQFQESYNHNEHRKTQENSDALAERGRELGIEEYMDNEITSEIP